MLPVSQKLPRLSTVWFVASLSLTLWLAFGRPSVQPQPAHASVNSTAIKAPSLSTAKPVSRVKPISEAQLGERTIGKNPLREQVDEELLEPDQQTWRKLTLRLPKENGKWLTVELLRPLDWIEDEEAAVGETIFLDLEEMGAVGDADVLSIEPCPPIQPGKGNVITGRFIHEVDQGDVVELRLANQADPIRVTASHPHWSVDRGEFISAGELREGERLDCLNGTAITTVSSITPIDYSGLVYNLEIHGEHVYRVGADGVLAHNACPNPWGRRGSPAHKAKVFQAEARLNGMGWKTVSGGREKERFFGSRMPDLVVEKGGAQLAVQVGRRNAGNNLPVARERRAIADLKTWRNPKTGLGFLNVLFLRY